MAEIVYDVAPGNQRHRLRHGGGRAAGEGELDRLAREPRRQGHRRRHQLHHRAVLPGRRRRAGRRSREGRRRRLLHRRRERRRPELGGHLQRRRRQPGLRSGPGGGHHPDDRDDPGRRDRDDRAPVGAAVGHGDDEFRLRRLRHRRGDAGAARHGSGHRHRRDGHSHGVRRRDRAGPGSQTLGIRIRRVAGPGEPVYEVHRLHERRAPEHRVRHRLRCGQPGRGLGARRADGRGVSVEHPDRPGAVQRARAGRPPLHGERHAAGDTGRAPEAEPRRVRMPSRRPCRASSRSAARARRRRRPPVSPRCSSPRTPG